MKRSIVFAASIVAAVGCGSQGPSQSTSGPIPKDKPAPSLVADVQTIAVTRTGRSTVVAHTIPNAACDFFGATLHSDGAGDVRFSVMRPTATSPVDDVAFDCTAAGQDQATRYPVHFALVDYAIAKPVSRAAALRPALVGDPMSYANKDLLAMGYPPRLTDKPGPVLDRWLKWVSTPRMVPTSQPQTATIRHTMGYGVDLGNNKVSANWSGYMLNSSQTHLEANGTIHVPTMPTQWDSDSWDIYVTTEVDMWVGLDGWGYGELPQAGTQCFWVGYRPSLTVPENELSSYQSCGMWTEYFPDGAIDPGYPVNLGDNINVDVAATDVNGAIDANGGYAVFVLTDDGAGGGWGWQYTAMAHNPSSLPFTGATADFILEKSEWTSNEPDPFGGTYQYPLGKWNGVEAYIANPTSMTPWTTESLAIGNGNGVIANSEIDMAYDQADTRQMATAWYFDGSLIYIPLLQAFATPPVAPDTIGFNWVGY